MRVITFAMQADIAEEVQDEILERIRAVPGVSQAQRLNSQAKKQSIRRLGYAYVGDQADVVKVLGKINAVTGVEQADLATPRHLVPGQ